MDYIIYFAIVQPELAAQAENLVRNRKAFVNRHALCSFQKRRRANDTDASGMIAEAKVMTHEVMVAFFFRKEPFNHERSVSEHAGRNFG